MPMQLNVGWSQKVGQPDYGSLGASVHLQLEVEHDTVRQPENLQRKVEYLFRLARRSVEAELQAARTQSADAQQPARTNYNGNGQAPSAHPPASSQNRQTNGSHRASQKQLDYIRKLAGQTRGLGVRRVESLADTMFGKPVADLTSLDASGLIDCLKAIKAGEIDLDDALRGAAP